MGWLLLLLIFPLIWPFISKLIWPREIMWGELGAQALIVSLLVFGVYELGRIGQTHDTEIYNGQITAKHRQQGEYTETYSCHCHEECWGSRKSRSCHQECDTCTREHYTVNWFLNTTIGNIKIDSKDWTSPLVWALPNPAIYNSAYIGQACSQEESYTNYVKAAPDSLFAAVSHMVQKKFKAEIPSYPRVYDIYHISRVINVGSHLDAATLTRFNHQLNDVNKNLGPLKQANIIVIVTSITDPMYRYAVENAWLGGKKNDIVIFIGSKDSNHIDWVDIMTWALNKGNGIFHATLRNDIMNAGVIDPNVIVPIINTDVMRLYTRPHMKDFQYLDAEITPPTWVLIIALVLGIIGSIGCTFAWFKIFHDNHF